MFSQGASMAPRHVTSPTLTLLAVFVAWKAFLLALAAGSCVGPSYDTSGFLLNRVRPGSGLNVSTRLTSWDAIYFLQNARRGYLYEQEWAFGSGLPTVITLLSKVIGYLPLGGHEPSEALLGTIIAHTSHLFSALALYQLSIVIWRDHRLSFLSACLHILSPAGLFLSAPYQESTFALLSFLGYLSFAQGCRQESQPLGRNAYLILSGFMFGLATTFRSNGILNGALFVLQAIRTAQDLFRHPNVTNISRLVCVGLGGMCVGAGLVVPQVIAYQRFCSGVVGTPRPWCTWTVPSIYSFVQDHYWDNGAFRYWTIPNAPLFMLAAPMVFIMVRSGVSYLFGRQIPLGTKPRPATGVVAGNELQAMVKCLAFIQAFMALLVVVNHHVQIITRLSSGYPVWYWWLASSLQQGGTTQGARSLTVFLMMYASIQAVLFASFLPPA